MALNLNELDKNLDDALAKETSKSLTDFLQSVKRKAYQNLEKDELIDLLIEAENRKPIEYYPIWVTPYYPPQYPYWGDGTSYPTYTNPLNPTV